MMRGLCAASLVVLICLVLAPLLQAQELPRLGTTFFSVDITRNDTPLLTGSIFKSTDDHLIIKGSALASVIARAYGVLDYQVVDGPDWVYASHLYDIEAVPPPLFVAADEAQMLQNMLADNFGLALHRDTREVDMLVLVPDETAQVPEPLAGDAYLVPPARYRLGLGPITVRGQGSMGMLADSLAKVLGEPVLDRTGLQGIYKFELIGLLDDVDSHRKSLREALGLKLERRAVPLEVLVIDRITRPALDL